MQVINYFVLYWKPFVWSFISLTLICVTNKLSVLPIGGFYLIGYVALVSILTTWVSFVTLQNFLQRNKPVDSSKWMNFKDFNRKEDNLLNPVNVAQLTQEIEENFVDKWFTYVSKDKTFNEESEGILKEVLEKMIKVQVSLDNSLIIHGILNLYLKHLKEFRRSLKRRDRYSGDISDLYRYSHICSTSRKAQHYFIHQLTTNLLNHFISWELSNSLPYRVLISIISRKVITNLLNLLSNPEFLNYYLLKFCISLNKQEQLKLDEYNRIKIKDVTMNCDLTPKVLSKSNSGTNLTKLTPVTDATKLEVPETVSEIDGLKTPESISLMEKPPPKPKYDEIKSENVKIYEPKSCKTWYDSYDLHSVTIGQDILDMIEDSDKDVEHATEYDDISSPLTSAMNLFDEMKHITSLEGIKTSMKPISDATVSTVKDLQESTVNNVVKPVSQATTTAFHKIGGLNLQDEAAGVMEGILDFGRTKIRKGLRLTGLQDDEDPPKETSHKKNIVKMPHVRSQDKAEELETAWLNPLLQEETPKTDGKPETEHKHIHKVPSILTETHDDSPEPEYEETADLATSIAKLRSLLEQKSSESNLSTPSGLSPLPPLDDIDETDGMMPSFYKFCAKTATGVIHNTLNTIKTALPGNVSECDRFDGMEKWLFVESNSFEADLFARMDRLLNERKVFCTVDTAYEALSLQSLQMEDKLRQTSFQFEDELDDLEVKLPITKTVFDVICELLADNKDTPITQEPVIKSVLLLLGNYIEETTITKTNSFIQYWCCNTKIPSESNPKTLLLELDNFVDVLLSGVPDYFTYLIGEGTLKDAANLFVSSLQVQKINQDVVMQILEIVCMKLIDGSKQLSPISA